MNFNGGLTLKHTPWAQNFTLFSQFHTN